MDEFHTPVLLKEVISFLAIKPGERYIDATVGGGGHTLAILKAGGRVLGFDCDQEAIEYTRKKWEEEAGNQQPGLTLIKENFVHLGEVAIRSGFRNVAGILLDLGVSSHQLVMAKRGFSFKTSAPLDMRMDQDLAVTAADLINGLNEGELDELFKKYSEEYHSRTIARAIVRARTLKPVRTCDELAEIVSRVRRGRGRFDRIHPATRVFQALRIAVNDELNNLKEVLPQATDLLKNGGRLVVISFHSLEDRIVKNFFKEGKQEEKLKILTEKPIRPTLEEISVNPRSRSAKLRVAEKS